MLFSRCSILCVLLLAQLLLLLVAGTHAAEEPDARQQLRQKGIVLSSGGISLTDEANFRRAINDSRALIKELTAVHAAMADGEQTLAKYDNSTLAVQQRLLAVSAQLANVAQPSQARNQVVAANNALVAQLEVLRAQRPQILARLDELRSDATRKREAFVQYVMDLRKQSDSIQQQYETLAQDDQVRSWVGAVNRAESKSYAITPSKALLSLQKRLQALEKSVLSEEIPLRREGNSFYAAVMLNGEHVQEMVVDSGASIISLPLQLALEAGISPQASDPDIALTVADGRRVRGKLVKIKSVRVGQFVAEDVEAAVMDVPSGVAEPLLGMSFLGRYKFELNAAASRLSIVHVDADKKSSGKKKANQ